ncbi:MAG: response regulator [Acidobacteriota bacterium]|nr:response regulator [Blastocatellia bacterium]MDW8412454.1 response regulator [Acidobacteriota bacterium]
MTRKVLIADDNPQTLGSLAGLFSSLGYLVRTVANGDAVLQETHTFKPHLIVLDLFMPGRTGYEICSLLRKSSEYLQTPIILTFSEDEPFDPARAKRSGASRCIPKLIDRNTLAAVLDTLAIVDKVDEPTVIDEIEPLDEEDQKLPKILACTVSVNSLTGTHYVFQIAVESTPATSDLESDPLGVFSNQHYTQTCKECGHAISPEDLVCLGCGSPISSLAAQTSDWVICKICGKFTDKNDLFCVICGNAR